MKKTNQIHEGKNVKRFREMLGIKQETLAYELGEGWSQKKVSQLEAKESIEEDILDQVAKILNVSSDVIRHFNEESAVSIISSTLHEQSGSINYNFNPLEKLLEAHKENKILYERLLEAEKSKVELLEKLLKLK